MGKRLNVENGEMISRKVKGVKYMLKKLFTFLFISLEFWLALSANSVNLEASDSYEFPQSNWYGDREYESFRNSSLRIIENESSFTWTFTLFKSNYYSGKDATLVLLEKVKTLENSRMDWIPLRISLNGIEMFTCKLSPTQYAEVHIGFDLACDKNYNENGVNHLKVENLGDVPISIDSIFIYRIVASKKVDTLKEQITDAQNEALLYKTTTAIMGLLSVSLIILCYHFRKQRKIICPLKKGPIQSKDNGMGL